MARRTRILRGSLALILGVVLGPWGLYPAGGASAKDPEPGSFQVAFVTRLQSVDRLRDSGVLLKQGRAESLQSEVPGVFIGHYREEVLLTDPRNDPANGLFKFRETLRTPLGSLTWEGLVLIVASTAPFDGELAWARGTITRGTGVFAGTRGSVEITGRNAPCDPATEAFCVALEDDPSVGERQDFHVLLRGKIAEGSGGAGSGAGGRRNR